MTRRFASLLQGSLVATTLAAALLVGPGGAHAEAVGPGSLAVSARLCAAVPVDPTQCAAADGIGSVVFYAPDTGYVLNVSEATIHGGTAVWGETDLVPLTTYTFGTDGFQVPDGYAFRDIVVTPDANAPVPGEGWSVTLSESSPAAQIYVIYTPVAAADIDTDGDGASDVGEVEFGSDPLDPSDFPAVQAGPDAAETDSDSDGASDASEEAFGSDPFDASSFPAVQAGPESDQTDGDGASDAAEEAFGSDPLDASDFPAVQAGPDTTSATGPVRPAVVTLPNTGTGTAPDTTATGTLQGLLALAAALGLASAGSRRLVPRRNA